MEYNKYDIGPYNLHIINTNKFKTVSVRVNFKRPCVKNEITKRSFLSYLLLESSRNYKSRRMLEIETENLYNLKYSSYNTISGNYNVMTFEETFLNEKYTEKGYIEKSISFLLELIFNPDVYNNKFSKESFDLVKKLIKENIETVKERTSYYSNMRMYEEMDKKSILSYRSIGYLSDLNKINESNIYKYYLSILDSDIVDIFIIGDVDKNNIRKIITKLFNINTIKKQSKSHILIHDRFRKQIKVVKEKMDIEQSKLVIGCKLNGLTEFERKYVMGMYSYILGGGVDSKLFKEVREKNSLCYSINSIYNGVFNILKISAGIDSKNFEKTVKIIKKQLKDLSLGKFTERDIKCAYMTYLSTFKEIMDNQDSLLTSYMSMEYLNLDTFDVREKKLKKVTKDMIINVSKKIMIDTIYLLEDSHD